MPLPSRSEIIAYITQRAIAEGIDPRVAIQIANGESGLNPGIQSRFPRKGGGGAERSYNLYQFNYDGGMGNDFTAATGLDARDPNSWKQVVDFALRQAKQGGWTPWSYATNAGIGKWQGIKGTGAPGSSARNPTVADDGLRQPAPDYANDLSGVAGAGDMNIFGIPNSELADIFKERNSTKTQKLGGKLWEMVDPSVKGMRQADRPQGLLPAIMNFGKGTGGQGPATELPPQPLVGPDAEKQAANDPHYNQFGITPPPKKKKGATVGSTLAGMFMGQPKPQAAPAPQQPPMSDPKTLLGFLVGKKLFEQA